MTAARKVLAERTATARRQRLFEEVVTLVRKLHDEEMREAQGDNGSDVRDRRADYAFKFNALLDQHGWRRTHDH